MSEFLITLGLSKYIPPPALNVTINQNSDSNPESAQDGSGNPVDYMKGQIHRANILDVLAYGPQTAAFIADEIGMKRHAISHHLVKLLEAGVIARTPESERKSTERAKYWIA